MNPMSGEVVADIEAINEMKRKLYEIVPETHQQDAHEFLAGRESAFLDMKQKENPLVKLAAQMRAEKKKAKNRAKNKTARASRKRS